MILNSPGTRIGVKHAPCVCVWRFSAWQYVSWYEQMRRSSDLCCHCSGYGDSSKSSLKSYHKFTTSRHGFTSNFKQKEPLKTTGVNDAKDSKCADLEMALAASGNHALCTRQMTNHFELKKKTPMAWHTPGWVMRSILRQNRKSESAAVAKPLQGSSAQNTQNIHVLKTACYDHTFLCVVQVEAFQVIRRQLWKHGANRDAGSGVTLTVDISWNSWYL